MAANRSCRSAISCTRPWLLEVLDGPAHLAARQLLDDVLEGGVLLPDDLVQPDGLHPGLLELLIGAPGLDRLMLADVAHEQHAVLGTEPLEELVHLLRARQARLIEHVEVLGSVARGIGLREMALQVLVVMPASASFWAARDVGANPSTR